MYMYVENDLYQTQQISLLYEKCLWQSYFTWETADLNFKSSAVQ